jgi:hypothetical protein
MRWARLVVRMGEGKEVLWGNLKEIDQWENPGVDGNIILRWLLRKWDVEEWTWSICLRIGTGGGLL